VNRIRRRIALLVFSSALPALASAGNGISAITLRSEPNLTSVAVQAIVSGDDDSSAVLRIFQKWRENAAYDTGMVMVRRVGTNIHEGRILWMTPGRTADYYVDGRDAGGSLTTPAQVAAVQPIRPLIATGPVFYVDQRIGDDAWDGRAPGVGNGISGPKRTLRAALGALASSPGAGRDGGVFVAPGEYHERLTLDFGSDGDHHFLEGDGTNRDSTIICGANPVVEHGEWAPGHPLAWTLTQDSTYVTRFDGATPGSSPGDSTQLVVIGWGEYLHRKTSVKAVLDDSTWTGRTESTNAGELSGWFWRNDSLYVKRRNGQSPAGLTLHTGYLDDLIDVRRRNWRIAGLTFRFAGGASGDPAHPANPDPPLSGHGIAAGLNGTASGLVVDSCRFYGHNSDAIYVVHGAGGERADSVTIAHCIVDGLTVGSMAYGAGKARAEERVGEIQLLSRAANVFDNVITGGFNGLELGPGDPVAGPRDSTWGSQNEIANNTFTNLVDDAIEMDTSHDINTLLFGNTIRGAGHGISQVPTYTGPTWVFYNTIANCRSGGIKVGEGTRGITWYIHNTITSSNANSWAIDGSPGGVVDQLHFRNNILVARGDNSGFTIWGPIQTFNTTNDFNYDLLDSLGTLRLVSWGGSPYSFPELRSALGWEANGVRAAAGFVDSSRFNWSLLPSSAAIGRGQRITGVNTSLDGPRYKGAPDLGVARSLPPLADAPPLPAGPLTRLAARAAPNPFHGEAQLEYALPAPADVSVRLYDANGRVVCTLLDHARQAAGTYRLAVQGRALRPGIYLYQVVAGTERVQGKLALVR
jgi:hypothetical protein